MGKLKKDASAGRRTQYGSSEATCNDYKEYHKSERYTCDCQAEVDGIILNFIDECEYCNDDLRICVQKSYGKLYGENRYDIGYMYSFVYIKGRNEIVTSRVELIGDDSCQVFLDGQECESCTLNMCTCILYTSPSPRERTRARMPP